MANISMSYVRFAELRSIVVWKVQNIRGMSIHSDRNSQFNSCKKPHKMQKKKNVRPLGVDVGYAIFRPMRQTWHRVTTVWAEAWTDTKCPPSNTAHDTFINRLMRFSSAVCGNAIIYRSSANKSLSRQRSCYSPWVVWFNSLYSVEVELAFHS